MEHIPSSSSEEPSLQKWAHGTQQAQPSCLTGDKDIIAEMQSRWRPRLSQPKSCGSKRYVGYSHSPAASLSLQHKMRLTKSCLGRYCALGIGSSRRHHPVHADAGKLLLACTSLSLPMRVNRRLEVRRRQPSKTGSNQCMECLQRHGCQNIALITQSACQKMHARVASQEHGCRAATPHLRKWTSPTLQLPQERLC